MAASRASSFRKDGSRWSLAVTLLVAASGHARHAAAEPRPSVRTQLEYSNLSGVPGCPDEAALRASVAARLGYDPFQNGAEDRLAVEIARTNKGLRGEVRLISASRPPARGRVFEAPRDDCAELGKTLALAMSIAIDATRQEASSAPSTGETHHSDSLGVALPKAPDPASPAADTNISEVRDPKEPADVGTDAGDRERQGGFPIVARVGAGAIVSTGLLPSPGPGGFVAIGVGYRSLSLDAEGRLDASQVQAYGRGEIEISANTVMLVPCLRVNLWAFCGLLTGGVLRGSGSGYDITYKGTSPLWEAGARVGFAYPLSKIMEIAAFAEGQLALKRTSFNVDGASVWRVRPATFGVASAIFLHFH